MKEEKEMPAWMKDEPFTKEQVSFYNQFTHFPTDINKEFKERVKAKEQEIIEKLGEIPENVKKALYWWRKALYEWYLEEARARAIAPPISVVGRSKYRGKPERAFKIMEKATEKLHKAEEKLEDEVMKEISKRYKEKVKKTVKLTFDQLKGQKLKKDLGLDYALKSYHNKHKDGSGNFGIILMKKGFRIVLHGKYLPDKKVYDLMIETPHQAPTYIKERIHTYEDLINYLKKVFAKELEEKKPEKIEKSEEKPKFYYQETLIPSKEKQLKFAVVTPLQKRKEEEKRKELTEEEKRILRRKRGLEKYGVEIREKGQTKLSDFAPAIALAGTMLLLFIIYINKRRGG